MEKKGKGGFRREKEVVMDKRGSEKVSSERQHLKLHAFMDNTITYTQTRRFPRGVSILILITHNIITFTLCRLKYDAFFRKMLSGFHVRHRILTVGFPE